MAATIPLQILDSIKQPASLADRNYNYTFVNQAFCDHYQKAQEEIIGSPMENLIGKESFQNQVKPHIDICLKGEEVSYQYSHLISGNRDSVNQIHLYPCYTDDGAIDGVISISEVQTEQQTIQKLKGSEQEFRMQNVEWLSQRALDFLELPSVEKIYQYIGKNLTGLVPHSLIIINDINEQKETVTPRYMFGINNNTFRKVINTLGMNPIGKEYPFAEELKDCYKKQRLVEFQGGLDEFSFGHMNKTLVSQVEKLLSLKAIYTIGLRRENRLFSAIHLLKFHTSEIQYFNMVETFLNQASIALQRKMLENELRKAKEKAEENERLKTAFLANLSHEIRTPLNIILGYVQLLNTPNLVPEDKTQYINAIHESSDHLTDIIDDVLSMAKLETGQQSLQISPFNLNALILEIYLSFQSKARRKNIRFESVTPLPDDKSTIQSDENKIRQILANLLNNAFKFTPEEGEISFGYSVTNNHINFFVKDNGIGISEEHHNMIFERFTQVEDSNQRKYEGTGLGLPISKGLVELLGGTIQVESKSDQGSTFSFAITLKR